VRVRDHTAEEAERLARSLRDFIREGAPGSGVSTRAVDPGHRIPFRWPPHPVSYKYHVLTSDWRGREKVQIHGETFELQVAKTPFGVFGRSDELWLEAKGSSLGSMIAQFKKAAEPLFARQFAIAETLGQKGRFKGHVRDLPNESLLRLLYCPDRDVANEARTVIELHASQGVFLPALLEVLRDERHPLRRSAQWCVLDLFEDFGSFCKTHEEGVEVAQAMRALLWSAEDDYARTIYKAGVVLGGHLPGEIGGPVLIECLEAPSRIGRRAAIHGLYHVVEWEPAMREQVVAALGAVASSDPEPLLREYAGRMSQDIASGAVEHAAEPRFRGED
jgi:hypothetical protein